MKIKGRIVQIVPPEKHEDFILPYFPHLKDSSLHGKHFLRIFRPDVPLSYFKRLIWSWKHGKEDWVWYVVMDGCPYREGEMVELDVETYYHPTELFMVKEITAENLTIGDLDKLPIEELKRIRKDLNDIIHHTMSSLALVDYECRSKISKKAREGMGE